MYVYYVYYEVKMAVDRCQTPCLSTHQATIYINKSCMYTARNIPEITAIKAKRRTNKNPPQHHC